jgi:hypothetical protein
MAALVEKMKKASEKINRVVLVGSMLMKGYALVGFVAQTKENMLSQVA